MLKKLKKRFLLAAMISLTVVIGIIIAAINIFNYVGVVSYADDMLELLSKNDGRFPPKPGPEMPGINIEITPETPYESRFFTIEFRGDELISVNTASIAAIDEAAAETMAGIAMRSYRDSGFIGNYRYKITDEGNRTTIIFLDCTRRLDSARTFLFLSITTSLLAIGIVFILLNIISMRIVQPISEGYEKQKQFITNAGHDIKTPLTIIDADAELLEMELGENEWLSDIRKQTSRLASLTNELIYLSRMEEVEHSPHIDFPLSDIAEEVINDFSSRTKTKNITISSSVPPAIFYCGDEESIRKLLTILFDNAIKYSPEGETVDFAVKKQGRGVNIKISNPAEGLTQEATLHMFDRFYRSDMARSSGGGFGIGLSVASAIVASHKGKISAAKQGDRLVIDINL